MKRIIQLVFLCLGLMLEVFGQSSNDSLLYRKAFAEQLEMLKGQKPIDFKRSVFLTENSFHKGQLNYQSYCKEISSTGQKLKEMIKAKGLEKYKTAGNWAVFTYMTDSLPANNFKPCTYDFDDFMADKDWTKMFVTKLMRTKTGNCHSLPFYYKILCEEIGANASLALAPNHVYIKHIDEKGQWTNVELTNGGFPRDQWIIEQMAISVEAIKSEIYMKPLTNKENIALCMFDLASAYKFQYGLDNFILEVCDTALNYFPKCIPLIMERANYYRNLIELEKKNIKPNTAFIDTNIALYKQSMNDIDSLGYKDMPPEVYEEWVKSVEDEKVKRGVMSNK